MTAIHFLLTGGQIAVLMGLAWKLRELNRLGGYLERMAGEHEHAVLMAECGGPKRGRTT